MYLTCNPGGVGHRWVKRLFIDKQYKTNELNPEENENPEDYTFIFATVDDNTHMLEHSPLYLKMLAQMPEDLRRAYRYGDWDSLGGGYFKEFQFATHMMKSFRIPEHWPRYRSFDYGLDMTACIWWAVDTDGRAWAYREVEEKGLIVQVAAQTILGNSPVHEKIQATYAPWDMWARSKESGKTMAEIFLTNGVPILQAPRDRVQGHMIVKSMMAQIPLKDPYVISLFQEGKAPATMPGLMLFSDLTKVAEDLRDIQSDENNINDCAKLPHEVTHTVDACVPYDTLILTPDGPVEIGDLTEEGTCYAWDGEKLVEATHSPSFMTRESAEVYELELDTGEKIKATAEHRVLTAAGWKRLDELSVGDDIISANLPV